MPNNLHSNSLRFIYGLDLQTDALSLSRQVDMALKAGATMIRYKNEHFSWRLLPEVMAIRNTCRCNRVPFLVEDDILLAKALEAEGVHLRRQTEAPAEIRSLLSATAIVGISLSQAQAIETIEPDFDYIEVEPDGIGVSIGETLSVSGALKRFLKLAPLPVVTAGEIDPVSAREYLSWGAAGIVASTYISRNDSPRHAAKAMASACGCMARSTIDTAWRDEFGLIQKLLQKATVVPQGKSAVLRIPPGDDACLLTALTNPVITTDTQREGVHFRFDWQTPVEIGQKAVAVTLSDLAASFASPVCLFVNLALPPYISESIVEGIYSGIGLALGRFGCALGGGNISAGDRLGLDLFAVGEGREGLFPVRSGARPGDGLYCTGPLGLARAGLGTLIKNDPDFPFLTACFKFPEARFDAAEILADKGVRCVIDVSDGLCGDAGHIAAASNISIEWHPSSADIAPELAAYCVKYRLDPWETVLSGGEDYELLFACEPGLFQSIKKDLPSAHAVGRCLPFQGRRFVNLPKDLRSFQHGGSNT